ncbi:DUF2207 domain-containing protein [Alkalibacter rhizosphaerae]|uniref:DUF2207 domain-containing protein n=1 Tax=Alkalibacter rhizosphaerae TaxID=2815577 RepID=A0A974XI63_9FIRM|nr:DUF2207 domain-containing protein [Alkalibacter rhizosphaerae]QSX08808.1 DUF2207 domain-containing protein [Alkalibacter rhizosphaerae]
MSNFNKSSIQMKKGILFAWIALLVLVWWPTTARAAVSDVDFDIDGYYIDAYVEEDGSMSVHEMLVYDGSFNGQFWNLEYASGGAKPTTGGLEDLSGNSPLYNAHGMTDIQVFSVIDPNAGLNQNNLVEFAVIPQGSGQPGDSGVYEQTVTDRTADLKIFSPTRNTTKVMLITYRLENVAVLHQDVGEVYWNFIGSGWEDVLNNVEINIFLPGSSEDLRVFAHGPLEGSSEIVADDQVRLSIDRMYPGEMLDGRVIFSRNLLISSAKTTNVNALEEILRVEQALADEANEIREDAQRRQSLFGGLGILGLLGMLVGGVAIYFKYDKEKKSQFQGKYFRELPADYGPAVMSYNYFQKRISPRDLTATILDLIRKKVFNLEINKVEKKRFLLGSKFVDEYTIVDNRENLRRELTREEELVRYWLIEKIGNGRSTTFEEIEDYSKDKKNAMEFFDDYDLWKTMVEGEAEDQGFFDPAARKGTLLGLLLGFVGILVGVVAIFNGILIGIANIPVGIIVIIYAATIKRRTKKGNEDYVKWKAFAEFLKDFSKLDDAVVPSIILWEHYLVYAVSLGIADKVIETMQVVLNPSDFNEPGLTFLRGSYGYGGFTAVRTLNTSLTNVTRSAVQTATTQHSSGTGGGGGFSGGGGGGGGGGSGGGGF